MRQLAIVLAVTLALNAPQPSEREAVLRTAGDYIAQYEREITAVSAEAVPWLPHYVQHIRFSIGYRDAGILLRPRANERSE